jgi:hypothetical protein
MQGSDGGGRAQVLRVGRAQIFCVGRCRGIVGAGSVYEESGLAEEVRGELSQGRPSLVCTQGGPSLVTVVWGDATAWVAVSGTGLFRGTRAGGKAGGFDTARGLDEGSPVATRPPKVSIGLGVSDMVVFDASATVRFAGEA